MSSQKIKILVVRNDKLGDFILSFPALELLKKNLPNCEITVLVPSYTEPLAAMNTSIDQILIDPGKDGNILLQWRLLKQIRQQKFDAVITLFSTFRIGLLMLLCAIPYRLAPATKLAQIFYNRRLLQRRSRSQKPEFEYNADLSREFLQQYCKIEAIQEPQAPYLHLKNKPDCQLFRQQFNLTGERPIIAIHPGSGGSANNLSLQQYANLAVHLRQKFDYDLFITAGPGEEQQAQTLLRLINYGFAQVYHSNQGIQAFASFLSCMDLFIAGSTGTLHLAAAMDIPTVGFYPRRRSATALRWQTLNSRKNRLAISPPLNAEAQDMNSISIEQSVDHLLSQFTPHWVAAGYKI